jgi:hypothetical protein
LSVEPLVFYTYSTVRPDDEEPRWHDDGIGDEFFSRPEDARQAVIELRRDLIQAAEEPLPPMQIEKVVTLPPTEKSILVLLNSGVGEFVQHCEVVETINEPQWQ